MQRSPKYFLLSTLVLAAGLALTFFSSSAHTSTAQDDQEQAHKDAVNRIIEEGFNQGNPAVVDELVAEDYVSYASDGSTETRDDFKQSIQSFHDAIADLHATADPLLADGEWVAFRFVLTGTFQNELVFPGEDPIPPTGQPLTFTANIIARFNEDGKLAEEWDESDTFVFLGQLGMLDDMLSMMQATEEAPAQ